MRVVLKMNSVLVLAAIAAFVLAVPCNKVMASDKTTICHVEDKVTGEGHVIEVSDSSLPGHMAHGDQGVGAVPVGTFCVVT